MIKKFLSLIIISFFFSGYIPQSDFLSEQKRYARVRTAIAEKQQTIERKLKENNLQTDNYDLLIMAFKDSDELELYMKKKQESTYKEVLTYEICSRSGELGPKRKRGDLQVPEGFYYIDRFNPVSNFYLSLGLNYPNKADRKKGKASNLGGDIFIHGSCVTIGCLPMTDEKIKEIYLYAVYAKHSGQSKIPVYVFPFRMNDENFRRYSEKYKNKTELTDFWTNLKTGYDKFMKDNRELKIEVKENGDYVF